VGLAAATAVALFALGVALSGALGPHFLAVVLIYAALSYAYCFGLKRIVIIDVMVLASGYALRAVGGAVAIQVDFSNWLLLCTSLLALFLGFCKRRQELTSLQEGAVAHRAVLARYTVSFLDQMIAVVTAATLISYIFYALSEEVAARLGTHRLGFTIPFVLYGIFRYFYLVHVRGEGGARARGAGRYPAPGQRAALRRGGRADPLLVPVGVSRYLLPEGAGDGDRHPE